MTPRPQPPHSHGEFYHIILRPRHLFSTFRTQDVGEKKGLERVAGKRRASGAWATHAWLVHTSMAHPAGKRLVMDHPDAQQLARGFVGTIAHVRGMVYAAKEKNVREVDKPTTAMQRARTANIAKAHKARSRR